MSAEYFRGLFISDDDPWSGGFFELCMQFERLTPGLQFSAQAALWGHESLQGPYLRPDIDPSAQPRVEPAMVADPSYGVATTPNRTHVACSSYWLEVADEGAWLSLALPMQSLGRAYPVGAYPFDDGLTLDWREPIMDWLRQVASMVHSHVPIDLGLVGWEPDDSGLTVAAIRTTGIPSARYDGILIPEGRQLSWYPPNRGAPMSFERGGA